MIFKNIVIAYDGSELAKKALNNAYHLAKDNLNTRLHVVHFCHFPGMVIGEAVIPLSTGTDNPDYVKAEQLLSEAKQLISHYENATFVIKQGQPAAELLQYADEQDCDLIIIGSRGLDGIREWVLGSVSHHVVQHSKIPVLVIK